MEIKKRFKISNLKSLEDFSFFIRQFSTDAIITSIYNISKEVYFRDCNVSSLKRHIREIDAKDGKILETDIIIQPWQFADLAFFSVLHSNDYRGLTELSCNMILLILGQTNVFVQMKTEQIIQNFQTSLDVSLHLYGFGGEQFKYETKNLSYRNLIRELYILLDLSHRYQQGLDLETDIEIEIGLKWDEVLLALFTIYMSSIKNPYVDDAKNHISFEDSKHKDEIFQKVIKYYSADYKEIRNSVLGRQIFYSKPYIINQRKQVLSISLYFNLFIIEHSLFWILRNFYSRKSKEENRKFITYFGFLYEKYFEELCQTYQIEARKIPQADHPRADWILSLGSYTILIEQKSSIIPISIKQQNTDFMLFKDEIVKKLIKGLVQLSSTEKDLNLNKPIKMLLCYDDYIDANILPVLLNDPISPVKNDGRYFIAKTLEIEMLLELNYANKEMIDKVLSMMLRRNKEEKEKGINLFNIMRENGWDTNSYFLNKRFDKYKSLFKNIQNKFTY